MRRFIARADRDGRIENLMSVGHDYPMKPGWVQITHDQFVRATTVGMGEEARLQDGEIVVAPSSRPIALVKERLEGRMRRAADQEFLQAVSLIDVLEELIARVEAVESQESKAQARGTPAVLEAAKAEIGRIRAWMNGMRSRIEDAASHEELCGLSRMKVR